MADIINMLLTIGTAALIFAVVCFITIIACLIHALFKGRILWFFIILFIPLLGALLYMLLARD